MVDAHCCFTCNTFHIVDNASIRSIFKGCQAILQGGGKLIVYGPFSVKGEHSSPSNARFDEQLRLTNPTSGVKDLHELDDIAMHFGFKTYRSLDMPHNNVVVVWEREAC